MRARGDGRSGSQNRGDGRQIGRGGEVCGGEEPFESLIPLKEVIAMANGFAVKGKRTEREYMRLLVQLGPEFEVLRKIPVEQISRTAGEQTGCLVDKLRKGKIKWNSGFDGEYGTIDPGVIQ